MLVKSDSLTRGGWQVLFKRPGRPANLTFLVVTFICPSLNTICCYSFLFSSAVCVCGQLCLIACW